MKLHEIKVARNVCNEGVEHGVLLDVIRGLLKKGEPIYFDVIANRGNKDLVIHNITRTKSGSLRTTTTSIKDERVGDVYEHGPISFINVGDAPEGGGMTVRSDMVDQLLTLKKHSDHWVLTNAGE